MKLIATKSMTYNTRRLVAGDSFEAKPRDARLLKAIRKAKDDDSKAQGLSAVQTLRAQYEAVVGKKPFMGWDADTLRQKIAAAQSED